MGQEANNGVEEKLWQNYRRDPSPENREALILHYLWYVRYICFKLSAELPPHIKLEDLISSGVVGLIDAIDKFDQRKNNLFRTYAFSRIRGAILDELRRLDWAPREVRRKARLIDKIREDLTQKLSRKPTYSEIAKELGMSTQEVARTLEDAKATSLLSLEESLYDYSFHKSVHRVDKVENKCSPNPQHILEDEETKKLLAEQIESLSEKERLVVTLYYYEELTFKEIGEVLGLSESRISQIHSQAVESIRKRIEKLIRVPEGDRSRV